MRFELKCTFRDKEAKESSRKKIHSDAKMPNKSIIIPGQFYTLF